MNATEFKKFQALAEKAVMPDAIGEVINAISPIEGRVPAPLELEIAFHDFRGAYANSLYAHLKLKSVLDQLINPDRKYEDGGDDNDD